MKRVFAILLLIVISSCKSDFDKNNLKFEIHKFYINENNNLSCFGYDLMDYNKITIDSIINLPKHLYLQEKISTEKSALEVHIKNKEHNPNFYYEILELNERNLDSLKNTFNKTNKDDLYYKCYFSYPISEFNIVILNEDYRPIECKAELLTE